jgi:hypothetical protein
MTDDDPPDPPAPPTGDDDDWYGEADPRVPDATAWPDRDLGFLPIATSGSSATTSSSARRP